MRNEILDHYNDEDIRNIWIKRDVAKWHKHLAAIKEEKGFFCRLIEAVKDDSSLIKKLSLENLKSRFDEVGQANDRYLDNLIDYRNQTENINECQDMQCEKFFLNSHEEFTKNIEAHLDSFRELKAQVREAFNGKLEIVLS